jgi:hypothetical protein
MLLFFTFVWLFFNFMLQILAFTLMLVVFMLFFCLCVVVSCLHATSSCLCIVAYCFCAIATWLHAVVFAFLHITLMSFMTFPYYCYLSLHHLHLLFIAFTLWKPHWISNEYYFLRYLEVWDLNFDFKKNLISWMNIKIEKKFHLRFNPVLKNS